MPCLKVDCGRNRLGLFTVIKDIVLIIAGHYCVSADYAELSHHAETEVTSLRLGIQQYLNKQEEGKSVKLVIWVNDIGISPVERKLFQQHYSIPDNYLNLITQAGINPSDVIIYFESQTRNRASKLVRHLKRDQANLVKEVSAIDRHLIRCVESDSPISATDDTKTVLTINDPRDKPLVIKENGAAKCCAILATFFSELENQFQSIEMIAIFNVLYIERIKAGIYVAQTLFDFATPINTLFCNETQIVMTEQHINNIERNKFKC